MWNAADKLRKMVTGTWPLSLASWRENFLPQRSCFLVHALDGSLWWLLSSHTGLTHLGTGLLSPLSLPSRVPCLAPGRRSHQVWRWQDLDMWKKTRHPVMVWGPRIQIQDLVSEQERPEEDVTVTWGLGEMQCQPTELLFDHSKGTRKWKRNRYAQGNTQINIPGRLTQWDQVAIGFQHHVSVQIPLSRCQLFPFFLGEDYGHIPEQVWLLKQQAGMLSAYFKETFLGGMRGDEGGLCRNGVLWWKRRLGLEASSMSRWQERVGVSKTVSKCSWTFLFTTNPSSVHRSGRKIKIQPSGVSPVVTSSIIKHVAYSILGKW